MDAKLLMPLTNDLKLLFAFLGVCINLMIIRNKMTSFLLNESIIAYVVGSKPLVKQLSPEGQSIWTQAFI